MSDVLQINEFEIEIDDTGTYACFEAVVNDIVQGAPATLYDPPEFHAAVCVARVRLSDDADLSEYEFDDAVQELAEDISDWQPVIG